MIKRIVANAKVSIAFLYKYSLSKLGKLERWQNLLKEEGCLSC